MLPTRRATRTTPATTTTPTTTVTNAQLQALIDQGVAAALAERDASRSRDGDNSHGSGTGGRRQVPTQRECTYTDFLKCQPINFKGTEGVVGLTQWAEKMESVFLISNCAITNQVKFASCTLQGSALTWWNSHVRAVGQDVAYTMPWTALKRMITDKYCPRGEIKKLESEYWNLKVRGTDLMTYNQRFQELALMCDRMFPEESAKVERYTTRKVTVPKLKNWKSRNRAGNGHAVARALCCADRKLNINAVSSVMENFVRVSLWRQDFNFHGGRTSRSRKQLEEVPIVQDFPEAEAAFSVDKAESVQCAINLALLKEMKTLSLTVTLQSKGAVVFALKIWRHYLYGTNDYELKIFPISPRKSNALANGIEQKGTKKPLRFGLSYNYGFGPSQRILEVLRWSKKTRKPKSEDEVRYLIENSKDPEKPEREVGTRTDGTLLSKTTELVAKLCITLERGRTFWKTGKVEPEVHSTFHVSNLKKCLSDEPLAVPLDEYLVMINSLILRTSGYLLEREIKKLRAKSYSNHHQSSWKSKRS
ncbi:putative reverse transcriptase domain-containing protein [Tanacetum coccineum]|uniref:Reverse transcriptase domain-containing protein n=1 Tax=Tanacetum coccineum TaxID=301880 RepID=A0ABQ4ZRF7_9ASTR